jgi:hypothetical protein
MSAATRNSWKTLPLPTKIEPLGFSALYDDAEADRLRLGLIPGAMEDKWFIFFDEGWLFFHRSWTGACIYGVRLDGSPNGVRVIDSWVNRDSDQYKCTDLAYDRKLVEFIIDAFLLGKSAKFPLPAGVSQQLPGVYQHSVVGRAYPEVVEAPIQKNTTWWTLFRDIFKRGE